MMQTAVKTKKPRKQAVSGRFWAMSPYRGHIKDDHKIDCYGEHGFTARFLYESVIITTPISTWQFGYHDRLKTLHHESTYKVNLKTGDPAKTHEQFRNRKMSNEEVIQYIADHDQWRQSLKMEK